jgi:hypothetical protein
VRLSVKPFVFGEKLHSLCQPGAVAGRTIFRSTGGGIFAFVPARRLQSQWCGGAQERRWKPRRHSRAGDGYLRDAAALWL